MEALEKKAALIPAAPPKCGIAEDLRADKKNQQGPKSKSSPLMDRM
jgi:hypothetical protein